MLKNMVQSIALWVARKALAYSGHQSLARFVKWYGAAQTSQCRLTVVGSSVRLELPATELQWHQWQTDNVLPPIPLQSYQQQSAA